MAGLSGQLVRMEIEHPTYRMTALIFANYSAGVQRIL